MRCGCVGRAAYIAGPFSSRRFALFDCCLSQRLRSTLVIWFQSGCRFLVVPSGTVERPHDAVQRTVRDVGDLYDARPRYRGGVGSDGNERLRHGHLLTVG